MAAYWWYDDGCWQTLGCPPDSDARAIKRAYLARLKTIRPDQDIAGFQALREAYEQALAWAREAAEAAVADGDSAPTHQPVQVSSGEQNVWEHSIPPVEEYPPVIPVAEIIRSRLAHLPDVPAWLLHMIAQDSPSQEHESSPAVGDLPPCPPGLPAWLVDVVQQAWVGSPSRVEPPDMAGCDLWRLMQAAKRAAQAGRLPAIVGVATIPAALQRLWQDRTWQSPQAQAALEQALFQRLCDGATQWESPSYSEGGSHRDAYSILLTEAATYYQWFSRKHAWAEQRRDALTRLRDSLLVYHRDQLWPDSDNIQNQIHCAKLLDELLQTRLLQQVDTRLRFDTLCAERLRDDKVWPHDWASFLFNIFNWHHDPNPALDDLRARFHHHDSADLLQRIAKGTETIDEVPQAVAQALLRSNIGWRLWRVSVKPEWQQQMRRALLWLKDNAPKALECVEPKVLRGWLAPRPVATEYWIFGGVIGVGVFAGLTLDKWPFDGSWFKLLGALVMSWLGAYVGYYLTRGLAWLRMQAVLRGYLPWMRWDMRLSQPIPLLRRWQDACDIGPTRHILPVMLFYLFILVRFVAGDGTSDRTEKILLALIPTALVGALWIGGMKFFVASPGALAWLDFYGQWQDRPET